MKTLDRKGLAPSASLLTSDDVEHDIILRMPPKRRYTIKLKITAIRKATPRFIEPDQD